MPCVPGELTGLGGEAQQEIGASQARRPGRGRCIKAKGIDVGVKIFLERKLTGTSLIDSMGGDCKNAALSNIQGEGNDTVLKHFQLFRCLFKTWSKAGEMAQGLKAPATRAWQSEVNP